MDSAVYRLSQENAVFGWGGCLRAPHVLYSMGLLGLLVTALLGGFFALFGGSIYSFML